MHTEPTTDAALASALADLAVAGYEAAFVFEPETIPPGIRCRGCNKRHLAERARVEDVRGGAAGRGTSPTVVVALSCPRCGVPGTLVLDPMQRSLAAAVGLLAARLDAIGAQTPEARRPA